MRYIVLLLAFGCIKPTEKVKERTIISVANTDDYNYSKWDTLVDAIIYVESRGNDSAVGDNGKAVGCLQIHPIMVREVNRLLAKYDIPTTYTLEDRYSREKSIEMFNIVSEEYYCCEDYTFMEYAEIVARRWNGGPRGDKKRSTLKYWNNVQKRI